MFRLTREVRFAITDQPTPGHGHAGRPGLGGLGHFFALRVTLAGEPAADSAYVVNIKHVDAAVRERGVPVVRRAVDDGSFGGGANVARALFDELRGAWAGARLVALELGLSPYLSLAAREEELPMVRVTQRFEFSAAHRLHNPALSDDANRALFGKCNHAAGHGHNYELAVTVVGEPGADGVVLPVGTLERIVDERAVRPFDHTHLNFDVDEFRGDGGAIPSVENIARAIYRRLDAPLRAAGARLASVTVWETPKTWCEYAEA